MVARPDKQQREFAEPQVYGDPATDYTLAEFSSALSSADAGLLDAAADLCDAMWSNSRVRGVLTTRIGALLGYNNTDGLSFESDADKVNEAIAEDWFVACPESELAKLIRWGLLLGIGFAYRKVVKRNGRWIPRIKIWHPRNFHWDTVALRWVGYDAKGVRFVVESGDPNWVIFSPYGESRPWAEGLWRTLALYWLIANRGWTAWGKHNDVHGSAGIVGKLPEGTNTQTPDARGFFADLQKLAKNARIVIPSGYEIDLLEAQGDTWTTFDKAIERADTAIAVATLGQPLTTEVPNAAKTGATAASAVRQDYLEFDAEQLSTWAHDAMLPTWAEWNFGDAELAPWLVYSVKPKEDLTAAATRLNTFAEGFGKLVQAAPQVDRKALLERFEIPILEGSSFEEEPEPAPMPEEPTGEPSAEEPSGNAEPDLFEGMTETLAERRPGDGFAEGQVYADRLAANARDEASTALSGELAELMHLIDELPDTPDWPAALRVALESHYGSMGQDEFVRIAARAMILAELAGRHAVMADVESEDESVEALTARIVELASEDGNEAEIVLLAKKAAARVYVRGPRGGSYYVTASGRKVYGKPRPGVDSVKDAPSVGTPKAASKAPKGGDGAGAEEASKPTSMANKAPDAGAVERAKQKLKDAPTEDLNAFNAQQSKLPKDYEKKVDKVAKPEHIDAIQHWSGEGYRGIRANYYAEDSDYIAYVKERGGYPPDDRAVNSAKKLEEFMSKAPKVNGEVYRGAGMSQAELVKLLDKGEFSMTGPTSTSRAANIATEFAADSVYGKSGAGKVPVVFSLKSKSGVDISKHSSLPEEQEVLFQHGSKFKVNGVRKMKTPDGKVMVIVDGVES